MNGIGCQVSSVNRQRGNAVCSGWTISRKHLQVPTFRFTSYNLGKEQKTKSESQYQHTFCYLRGWLRSEKMDRRFQEAGGSLEWSEGGSFHRANSAKPKWAALVSEPPCSDNQFWICRGRVSWEDMHSTVYLSSVLGYRENSSRVRLEFDVVGFLVPAKHAGILPQTPEGSMGWSESPSSNSASSLQNWGAIGN